MNLFGKLMGAVREVATGVHPDKHPSLNFLWQNGKNVRFSENGVKPIGGWYSDMTGQDLISTLRGGGWWRNGNEMIGLVGNFTDLYLIENTVGEFAPTLTQLATALPGLQFESGPNKACVWSVCQWGTWRLVTNGTASGPWRWNADDELIELTDIQGSPQIFLTHGPHVLAFNFGIAPNRFAWCSADDVDTWTTAADNTAGDLDVREFSNGIIAATYLGDAIAIYSDNQMGIVNYLGAPLVYGYDVTISEGVGAYSKNSVFTVGNLNYGVCRNGFFKTDGVSYELIGMGSVWDTFIGELNKGQTSLIHGYHLEKESELWWWYPVGSGNTNPSKAIVYNYRSDTWTFVEAERSGSIPPTDLEYPLAFRPDGYIFFHEVGTTEVRADYTDGPLEEFAIPCWIETKPMHMNQVQADGSVMNAEHKYKYIQAVLLSVTRYEDMGLLVRIGTKDNLTTGTVYWSDPFPDDLVWPLLSGRYIILRIEANTTKGPWELQAFDIHGKITGNVR